MSSDLGRGEANGDSPDAPIQPVSTGPPKAVEDVLDSDIGITTLLTRLKQSIASARDFAQFLKKRSSLEEEQATGLKRLAKAQLELKKNNETREGSYALQLADVMRVHDRMGDNGMQFALSLHQMHEDLQELSANMERGRKQWKHDGLDAEKRASDAEIAMQKAKMKYDGFAEDYDRAKTGDTKGSRRIGLKGPKSAEQYESDLQRKTMAADTDYKEKVDQAKSQRQHLINKARPEAVRALQELIRECDSALTLQLQKFATFNEKLLLGNGLAVSPLDDKDSPSSQRSLRDIVVAIDNDTDFHDFVGRQANKIPARAGEIEYFQHPSMKPKTQRPRQPSLSAASQPPPAAQPPLSVNTNTTPAGSLNSRYATQQPPSQPTPEKSYNAAPPSSYQPPPPQEIRSPSYGQQAQSPYNSQPTPIRDGYNQGPPYPTHPSERLPSAGPGVSNGYNPHQQTTGSIPAPVPAPAPMSVTMPPAVQTPASSRPPARPVFGVSLDDLFTRDQSAVPMVVFQCMQAVDNFALDNEGIYRASGASSHVNALRHAFDTLPPSAPQLDFRTPTTFFHDINAVTTLLKSFFRDLPDPLLTNAQYAHFIAAARIENDDARRDAMHQGINDLPDPNYATLRALVLHLHRVMQHEERNRMGSGNLAVCFAPSLMGTQHGGHIGDAALQAKVVDTILVHATAIFDDD